MSSDLAKKMMKIGWERSKDETEYAAKKLKHEYKTI